MNIIFYCFSFFLLFSACQVVLSRNPVYSVFSLIFAFFNAAGLFLLLGAEFLSMVVIVVYVGAVAVLFLFIVMMVDVDEQGLKAYDVPGWRCVLTCCSSIVCLCCSVGVLFFFMTPMFCALLPLAPIPVLPELLAGTTCALILVCVNYIMTKLLMRNLVGIVSQFIALMPLSMMGLGLSFALVCLIFLGLGKGLSIPQVVAHTATTSSSNIHALGLVLYTRYVAAFQGVGLILLTAMIGALCLCLKRRPGVKRQNVLEQLRTTKQDVLDIKHMPSRKGIPWPST